MLFGDPFDAAEAHRIGLVTALADDAGELDRLVAERTGRIAALPRAAVHATKALLTDDTATTVTARFDLDRRVLQGLLAADRPGTRAVPVRQNLLMLDNLVPWRAPRSR